MKPFSELKLEAGSLVRTESFAFHLGPHLCSLSPILIETKRSVQYVGEVDLVINS